MRRVCEECLNSDKRLKPQLVASPPDMDDDAKSDVSDWLSHRTESALSGRDESDAGGLGADEGPNDPQPGT